MIRNGYYYPVEMYEHLTHIDKNTGSIAGSAIIGCCFGNRTAGKTVGHAIKLIDLFNESGYTAALLVRTKDDMKNGYLEKWWTSKIFPADDFEGKIKAFRNRDIQFSAEKMVVDGKDFCYCIPISMSSKIKDTFGGIKCATLLMDEAYQTGERTLMLGVRARPAMARIFEIWQTIARNWDNAINLTHIIFLANVSERDNWIFNDLGVNTFFRPDTKRTCQKGIYVEIVNNKTAAKFVSESLMGEIMRNSISGAAQFEANQNNMFLDNKAFVVSAGLDFRNCIMQLAIREHTLGVFRTSLGIHISKINRDSRISCVCNDVSVHTEGVEFDVSNQWGQMLQEVYANGKVTFQTQESKGLFFEYINNRRY